MADFSQNATQLPAPSTRAGIIQGVQTPPNQVQLPTDLLEMGLNSAKQIVKDQAKSKTNQISLGYSTELTTYAQALETGQVTPEKAELLIRSAGRKYAAMAGGDPELIKQLNQMKDNLFGLTSLSQVDAAAQQESDRRTRQINMAIDAGFVVPPNASEDYLDSLIYTNSEMQRAKDQQERALKLEANQRARSSENRSVVQFGQSQENRRLEEEARKTVLSIYSANWDTSRALGDQLLQDVQSGALRPEEALAQLQQEKSRVGGYLLAAADADPAGARPYQDNYNELFKSLEMRLDPDADLDALNRDVETREARFTLAALSDPETSAFVMSSKLLGPNVISQLAQPAQFAATYSRFLQIGNTNPPQLAGAGNQDTARGVYGAVQGGLNSLRTTNDPEGVKGEVKTVLDNVLKGIGNMDSNAELTGADFKEFTEFMSNPSMVTAINEGLVTRPIAERAKRVWQANYERDVVNGVDDILNTQLTSYSPVGGSISPSATRGTVGGSSFQLKEFVDVQFDGQAVQFVPVQSGNALRDNLVRSSVRDLNKLNNAVNTLVRTGAHLQGTTDYASYWEANKHIILPEYYADPNKVREGEVVTRNGVQFRYTGGPPKRADSWERMDGGTE